MTQTHVRTAMPRRLPAVPLPLVGESLFSWVDHLTFAYDIDRTTMMQLLGLEPRKTHAFKLAQCTTFLTLPEVESLIRATGLWPGAVASLTKHGVARSRVGSGQQRALRETAAFCPTCLKDPARWPLAWYEWWAVLCPVHACYLVSYCPHCLGRFDPSESRSNATGRCPKFAGGRYEGEPGPGGRRKKRGRCGQPLWEAPTQPVTDPQLQEIHGKLQAAHARDTNDGRRQSSQWFDDFMAVYRLASNYSTVRASDSPDPVLQSRFGDKMPTTVVDDGDSIYWHKDQTGLLSPMRRTSLGGYGLDDPVNIAAKVRTAGQILHSEDPAATARGLLDLRGYHGLFSGGRPQDWEARVERRLLAASPRLDGFIQLWLDKAEFARLRERRKENARARAQWEAESPSGGRA